VVIDDAHEMTEQAQNALLKSLEEPPATSHVFLVTASPQSLLPTIRSRCQLVSLGPIPLSLLAEHLEKRLGLSAHEARLRAALANGSLGAALAFASEAYRERREFLLGMLEKLPEGGSVERIEAADELSDATGGDPEGSLLTLRTLLRDVAALRLAPGATPLNADVSDRLAALAKGPLGERAARVAEAAGETLLSLGGNAYKPLAFDLLLDELAG
jgi:DNA polymerase-3 subunit delta'